MATQEATQPKSIWKIDPAHTLVQFSAKHMMISTVKGQFKQVIAEVDWDEQDVTKSSVVATIDASSLVTGGVLVGDTIKIELEVELVKVKDAEPAAQTAQA